MIKTKVNFLTAFVRIYLQITTNNLLISFYFKTDNTSWRQRLISFLLIFNQRPYQVVVLE